MLRDMLWLVSISSVNVAGTGSDDTVSIVCGRAVLAQLEIGGLEAGDVATASVDDGGLESDAHHLRRLNYLERLEFDLVADDGRVAEVGLDRQRARLERVEVLPFGHVGRPVAVGGEQFAVDIEADSGHWCLLGRGHAGDDPDATVEPGPPERRRDAHRVSDLIAGASVCRRRHGQNGQDRGDAEQAPRDRYSASSTK